MKSCLIRSATSIWLGQNNLKNLYFWCCVFGCTHLRLPRILDDKKNEIIVKICPQLVIYFRFIWNLFFSNITLTQKAQLVTLLTDVQLWQCSQNSTNWVFHNQKFNLWFSTEDSRGISQQPDWRYGHCIKLNMNIAMSY